jgi:hypothetical protein
VKKFNISPEAARLLAVGLYRQVEQFVREADPTDLEKFRADYERKRATQPPNQKTQKKAKGGKKP